MKWALPIAGAVLAWGAAAETWRFDSLQRIGGHAVKVEGAPRIVDGAVVFDGVRDALFFDVHPLAGARQWTWEAIFRPDGGAAEQRLFHLHTEGAATRMLFEIRVANGEWWLDSYAHFGTQGKALIDPAKRHPLGKWYAVAAVYDGRTFRNYVDGVLQGEAEIALEPQGAGTISVGTRINRVNYFKGAVKSARFTRRALPPAQFVRPPRQ
ncbi:MAG TPA: LamG-like jellyroll fold domain-containing protein [Candidatus Acidoferrum sp.]|nr:LamG-like jellyroll fold domain-containing protein [Candidatus Acidoferrum sp.]